MNTYAQSMYLFRARQMEKVAAGLLGGVLGGAGQAVGSGLRWTIRKGWKPMLLAGAVGLPLYAGYQLATNPRAPTHAERAQSVRQQVLAGGSGRSPNMSTWDAPSAPVTNLPPQHRTGTEAEPEEEY